MLGSSRMTHAAQALAVSSGTRALVDSQFCWAASLGFASLPTIARFLLFFAPALLAASGEQLPQVETTCGSVEGSWLSRPEGTAAFVGIPYAVPPMGPLRWKAPVAPTAQNMGCWNGTLRATDPGPACLQSTRCSTHTACCLACLQSTQQPVACLHCFISLAAGFQVCQTTQTLQSAGAQVWPRCFSQRGLPQIARAHC